GGIVGVEEHAELRRVEILRVLDRSRLLDPVGIVEDDAEIADAADAGFRADRRLPGLDARIAEDALLRLSGGPVVVDLLVGAPRDAHAPAAAFLLVDQDDAVFRPLVDRSARAGSETGRVEAVLAQPRQVHHEGLFELAVNLLLRHVLEVVVVAALFELAAEHVLPVAAPLDLVEPLTRHQRARPRGGLRLELGCGLQPFVFERVRLVEVVDLRQVRVGEDLRQDAPLGALLGLDLAVGLADPAALPAFLVLPILRVTDAGLGLDVVEPDVFHPFAVGPNVLAGDRARVTADALVEVEHHGDLCADFHSAASIFPVPQSAVPPSTFAVSSAALSNQFTSLILRTITNSSRFAPTVP